MFDTIDGAGYKYSGGRFSFCFLRGERGGAVVLVSVVIWTGESIEEGSTGLTGVDILSLVVAGGRC